jgi:hypothetical protein
MPTRAINARAKISRMLFLAKFDEVEGRKISWI